jgi:hypothetical protein
LVSGKTNMFRTSMPPDEDGLYHVLLPCDHETLITRELALIGWHIPNVTCPECQGGPFMVVPVTNLNLDMVGAWGPRSPYGVTFIAGPQPEELNQP